MRLLEKARTILRNRLRQTIRQEVDAAVDRILPLIPQLIEFQQSPPQARQSFHDGTKSPLQNHRYYCDLKARLVQNGVPVEPFEILLLEGERR